MDNQHLSSEKEKVQRLSHKGVLNNIDSYIIWETPPIQNKIYIYKLISNLNKEVRYIGITNNPKTRLSHHIKDKSKSHKTSWIKSVIKNNNSIIMIIFDIADNLEDALIKEEYYIKTFKNLTNLDFSPTQPNSKNCYIYDIFTKKVQNFKSLESAAYYCNITPSGLYRKIIKGKYIFSYENNFENIINSIYNIILKKDNIIIKCVSYKQAAYELNCSVGMITACLSKVRKSCKGWVIYKKDEIPKNYKYRNSKEIICITDNKTYKSIKEASLYYNIDSSLITKCCKNIRKQTKGYEFRYLNNDIVQV